MAAAAKTLITPALFDFYRDLARHNDRAWFKANQDRYEETVRDPLLAFVAGFATRLRRISPHFLADPRPIGGSLFRIQRDVRFSKDKSPYKTSAGVHFRHDAGKDAYTPGFYLHLEPGNVFAGAGIWHPDSGSLLAIRNAIVDDPAAWRRAVSGKKFRSELTLSDDEPLKRAPRGFDPEHPCVEDLKRRSFIGVRDFSEKDACRPDFPERLAATFSAGSPLMRFLTAALGLAC
jgi:uncharacterized protein (TIGR02453 family)